MDILLPLMLLPPLVGTALNGLFGGVFHRQRCPWWDAARPGFL